MGNLGDQLAVVSVTREVKFSGKVIQMN